jgi:hypothetical protein
MLDDPVLEGMERDDDEARARGDNPGHRLQELCQTLELVVDLDTQGLKDLGGRVDLPFLGDPVTNPFDEDTEVGRHLELPDFPAGHDLAGQPLGLPSSPYSWKRWASFGSE